MLKYENQLNYKNIKYPSKGAPLGTISSSGCGCVSSVNVLRFFNIIVDVPTMAKKFLEKGFRVEGGTDVNASSKWLCKEYGLSCITTTDENILKQKLLEGCVAIANCDGDQGAKGIFSNGGHFFNIIGYDNKPPKPFVCVDPSYYTGKFSDSYRSKYVSVSKDEYGNIIEFTNQEALDIDTKNRNPQYWIFSKSGTGYKITSSVDDLINELIWRGIITNRKLWTDRGNNEEALRYLYDKYYWYILKNGGSVKANYPTIDEAITILQKQGVISSPDVWRDKVNFGDTDLQWLIMKMAGYIN